MILEFLKKIFNSKKKYKCDHDWERWKLINSHEDLFGLDATVQIRQCKKCGLHETKSL